MGNPLRNIAVDLFLSDVNRILERQQIGSAVALDNDTTQPEQAGAIVTPGIEGSTETLQDRHSCESR